MEGRLTRGTLCGLALLLFSLGTPAAESGPDEEHPVRIGVLAKRGAMQALQMWTPTAEYLTEHITGHRFRIVPLGFDEVVPATVEGHVDFLLANSGIYTELEITGDATRIATLRNRVAGAAVTHFGGVIFARANRPDIRTIDDLRGKRFMAVEHNSFGGFWAAWRELKRAGIDPYQDFSSFRFGGTHDGVVYAVLNGDVDAGTVRSDTLERMAQEGTIDLASFRILNAKHYDEFPHLCSTELYPEWPMAKARHTPDSLSDKVAMALLSIPPESDAARAGSYVGWTVPRDYHPVQQLMRELGIGPFSLSDQVSLQTVLHQYGTWLVAISAGVLLLGLSTTYVFTLNRRLRRSDTALRQAHELLELRVRERTESLEQTLQELEQSRRRIELTHRDWNDAFDAIQDPIFIHDRQLRIIHANPAYAARAGMGPDDLRGRLYWQIFPKLKGPLPACQEFPEHSATDDEEITLETGEILLSRSFGITHADGTLRNAIHILRDITREREAEAQRRMLSHALEQAREGILLLTSELAVLYINSACCKLLGRPREVLERRSAQALFLGGELETITTAARAESGWMGETLLLTIDGAIPVYLSAGTLRNGGGTQTGFVVTIMDLRSAKQAEEALRASRGNLAEAQHIAHLGSWEWDLAEDAFTWSDEVFRILGLESHARASCEAFLEIVHPGDRDRLASQVRRAQEHGEEFELDHRVVRPDGEVRLVHTIGRVTLDPEGRVSRLTGTLQDVTEARQSEQELRRLNRALRTLSRGNETLVRAREETELLGEICRVLVEVGGYRMAWVGYTEHDEDKSVRPVASAGFEEGYLEALPIRWSDGEYGTHPASIAIRTEAPFVAREIRSEPGFAPWRSEALKRGYASVIALPLITEGHVLGALTIDAEEPDAFDAHEQQLLLELANDLAFGIRTLRGRTERERAEEALHASEQRYHELYEHAPNAYASVQAADGLLLQLNETALHLLGYERHELERRKILELFADTPDGLPKARAVFQRFSQGESVRDRELQMRRKDGAPVWISLSVEPILGQDGRLIESRASFIDITRRKQAEQERNVMAERLRRSLIQTVQAMAVTIEKRDPYTAGHQERVAVLASAIGDKLGLTGERLEGLRLGATIHDIGKIYVPSELLNRPGRLSDLEYMVIQSHPTVGHEILAGVEFPWPVAQMVLQHHERLDGTGYPNGLKGEAIMLESRILAVADVVEAMSTHRPYRPALPLETALEEIERGSGKIYDPEVVQATLTLFREGFTWAEPARSYVPVAKR